MDRPVKPGDGDEGAAGLFQTFDVYADPQSRPARRRSSGFANRPAGLEVRDHVVINAELHRFLGILELRSAAPALFPSVDNGDPQEKLLPPVDRLSRQCVPHLFYRKSSICAILRMSARTPPGVFTGKQPPGDPGRGQPLEPSRPPTS